MIFDLIFIVIWLKILFVIGIVMIAAIFGVYMIRIYDRRLR